MVGYNLKVIWEISVKGGKPDWWLLGVPNVERLPAVKWCIKNLAKFDKDRRAELLENLKATLNPSLTISG